LQEDIKTKLKKDKEDKQKKSFNVFTDLHLKFTTPRLHYTMNQYQKTFRKKKKDTKKSKRSKGKKKKQTHYQINLGHNRFRIFYRHHHHNSSSTTTYSLPPLSIATLPRQHPTTNTTRPRCCDPGLDPLEIRDLAGDRDPALVLMPILLLSLP
jgi:hypothetical protein